MKEYRRIGDLVDLIDERNKDEKVKTLIGVSIDKCFIKSVANTIGTDLSKYQVIRKFDFACSLMQVSRDGKIPIACLKDYDEAIMSPAYYIFRIKNTEEILPDYMAMWFMRPEFDREASYIAVGGVRGSMPWEDFCDMKLPVPPLNEQQKIVNTYNAITNRIQIKQKINENLEKTAQCLFEELTKDKEPNGKLEDIANITMGQSPDGDSYNENGDGMIFYQGKSDFGFRFVSERIYTSQPTRFAKENDILLSVRAPVGVINITPKKCCIGRGLAAISSKLNQNSFLFYTLKSKDSAFEIYNGEGTVFGSINSEGLKNLEIVIPNEREISKFESSVSKIDEQIKNNELELIKLNQLKQLVVSQISKR